MADPRGEADEGALRLDFCRVGEARGAPRGARLAGISSPRRGGSAVKERDATCPTAAGYPAARPGSQAQVAGQFELRALFVASITNRKSARTLALDDDLGVPIAQLDLPNVAAGAVNLLGDQGSALATYLTLDVAVKLGDRATACLFASPRTGDGAWAKLFNSKVTSYELCNYILDLVTHVPSLGYATLSKATVLEPSTAQANIRLDIFCNHHVICYCAMIDYAAAVAAPTVLGDAKCKLCISPPPMSKAAIALADLIREFGIGDEKAIAMLKALYTISV